jgi:hypothetical protein
VVELRNRAAGSLVALPLAVQVLDKAKKSLYANDAPGLDASLVGVAALAGRERLACSESLIAPRRRRCSRRVWPPRPSRARRAARCSPPTSVTA